MNQHHGKNACIHRKASHKIKQNRTRTLRNESKEEP